MDRKTHLGKKPPSYNNKIIIISQKDRFTHALAHHNIVSLHLLLLAQQLVVLQLQARKKKKKQRAGK